MMRLLQLGAATCLAGCAALSASAAPTDWPAENSSDPEIAFHCAAVMTALGQAYEFAVGLTGTDRAAPPVQAPEPLIALAGGPERLGDITSHAQAWRDHWESLARTSVYPRLTQSGTPYLADDGAVLHQAASRCAHRFNL